MGNWYAATEPLKNAIIAVGEEIGDSNLFEYDHNEFLTKVSAQLGEEVTLDDLDIYAGIPLEKITGDEYFRPAIAAYHFATRERDSLSRLEQILGVKVQDLPDNELEQTAMQMFLMSVRDYKNKADELGIEYETKPMVPLEYFADVIIPIQMFAREKGIEISVAQMIERLRKHDFELDPFDDTFKRDFDKFSEGGIFQANTFYDLVSSFHETLSRYKDLKQKLEQDRTWFADIRTQPEPEQTAIIQLNYEAAQVAINTDGNIVVLSTYNDSKRKGIERTIQLLDVTNGKVLAQNKVGEDLQRDHNYGIKMRFAEHATLSVGTNGIIYVSGGRDRFTDSLQTLDNEDGFLDLQKSASDRLDWFVSDPIYTVLENKGIFHFVTYDQGAYPGARETGSHVRIVAYNSTTQEIDFKSGRFTAFPSMYRGGHNNPELAIHNKEMYLKIRGAIAQISPDDEKDLGFEIVDVVVPQRDRAYIPSLHRLDGNGNVWVLDTASNPQRDNKLEDIPTLKAYQKGPDGWNIVNQLEQPGFGKTNPDFANMSIRGNTLVWSNPVTKTLAVYKLE